MTVEERVISVISTQLNINKEKITTSSTLRDLGADSLAVMDLILGIEDEFDLQLSEQDQENIKTVKDIVNFIQLHLDPQK